MLLVGGIENRSGSSAALKSLLANSKVISIGSKPHYELPAWMQILDVALIPYRDTPLNRACSPMRLYDHLASGCPIVSTHWCEQVLEFSEYVKVGYGHEEFLDYLKEMLRNPFSNLIRERQVRAAEVNTWDDRASTMLDLINRFR
jgi:glycosyltransferase involved in cell wall biosynthesis